MSTSSVVKGESVLDTVATLEAMRTDYVVVRHSMSGIPNLIAKHTNASVINAGDGFHAHPTQGLLDVFTMREVFGGDVRGARVAFIGDIQHSRVARSTNLLCRRMGMQTAMLAPGSLIPRELPQEIAVFQDWKELYAWKPDVIYLLRVQTERQNVPFFPSIGEYHRLFGLTDERLKWARDNGIWSCTQARESRCGAHRLRHGVRAQPHRPAGGERHRRAHERALLAQARQLH